MDMKITNNIYNKDWMMPIPDALYLDKSRGLDIVVYTQIFAACYNANMPNYYISYDALLHYLYEDGGIKYGENEKKGLVKSVSRMCREGLIVIDNDFKNDSHGFVIADIPKPQYYAYVYARKIMRLFHEVKAKNKLILIQFYCYMMGTKSTQIKLRSKDDKTKFAGRMCQEYIAEKLKTTQSMVSKYVNSLESLHIIYVARSCTHQRLDGTVYTNTNVYGEYEDKDLIDKVAQTNIPDQQHIERSNNSRSMTQKYNMVKKGKPYSDDEMQELYDYCAARQDKFDLTIFDSWRSGNHSEARLATTADEKPRKQSSSAAHKHAQNAPAKQVSTKRSAIKRELISSSGQPDSDEVLCYADDAVKFTFNANWRRDATLDIL